MGHLQPILVPRNVFSWLSSEALRPTPLAIFAHGISCREISLSSKHLHCPQADGDLYLTPISILHPIAHSQCRWHRTMAEVVGLVVGAVGLAGVVGAFKDVVDLFSLFSDSRHLGRDYEILDAKLDIEKTMLLHWADRVGLLRVQYDRRLDEPNTRDTVFRVLACVRSLLSNASELKTKYGVRPSTEARSESATVDTPENTPLAISRLQMDRLNKEFGEMSKRMQIPRHTASLKNKFRWAIRDKQQFGILLTDLSHFITKLDGFIPTATPTYITPSDLQSIQDFRGLKIALEASLGLGKAPIVDVTQHAFDQVCQSSILDALWFRTINAREDQVKPAHA